MKINFPSIGEYNQAIQHNGSRVFNTLQNCVIIPSKTFPIKVFLYGSGAYAVVFKATNNGKNIAIRCFLSTEQENIDRYREICAYLSTIDASWKVETTFLENEILIKGKQYPALTMDWIEGVLLNQFITENLNNNAVLTALQNQLVAVSDNLEKNNIGHGDLQCGNIIVQKNFDSFQVKLIDYDGMFIPNFKGMKNLESGRSEFQHPKRTPNDFSPTIDRFSFWVMLTALEALKFNKQLWKEVMQGGFNTLDNMLFVIQDFIAPKQSKLFQRLQQINQPSLEFYTKKLVNFCSSNLNSIEKPCLFEGNVQFKNFEEKSFLSSEDKTPIEQELIIEKDKILIESNPSGINIFNSMSQKLGQTPLKLEKSNFIGKTLIAVYRTENKKIIVTDDSDIVKIFF